MPVQSSESEGASRARGRKGTDSDLRLRQLEARFRAISEGVVDGIFIKDARRRYTFLNPVAARWLGRPVEELLGKTPEEVFDPENARIVRETDDATFVGEVYSADREMVLGGVPRVFHTVQTPLFEPDGTVSSICGIVRDVTRRVQTERALREAEERLREVLESLPDMLYRRDLREDRCDMVNAAAATMTGYPVDWIMQSDLETVSQVVHPDDLPHLLRVFDDVKRSESGVGRVEYRIRRRDGEYRWCSEHFRVMRDAGGAPMRLVGSVRDMTEVREIEEQLRQAREELMLAQGSRVPGEWRWDLRDDSMIWSPEVYRMFGLDPDTHAATFESWASLVHPEDRDEASNRIWIALKSRVRMQNEYRIVLPTGEIRWIAALGETSYDGDGRPLWMVGLCMDITVHKVLEEKLRERSSQLARLTSELVTAEQRERNRLAERLHDDLQQLLVGARMHVHAASAGAAAGDRRRLDVAHEALDQALALARDITRDLSPPILLHRDLRLALAWLAQDMRERQGCNVTLRLDDLPGALPEGTMMLLFAAARELLLNVVKHAGVSRAAVRLRRVDGRLELETSDAGVGFDAGILVAPGGATGFGLLSLRERVALLGGELVIRSKLGKGTRATLKLPYGEGGSPAPPPPGPVPRRAPRRRGGEGGPAGAGRAGARRRK